MERGWREGGGEQKKSSEPPTWSNQKHRLQCGKTDNMQMNGKRRRRSSSEWIGRMDVCGCGAVGGRRTYWFKGFEQSDVVAHSHRFWRIWRG